MIILNDPYVSQYLIETIKKNNFEVLNNEIARKYFPENKLVQSTSSELIYSNSENSIDWVLENYPDVNISKAIQFCKDKAKFRECLREIFPDFYFRKYSLEELKSIQIENLTFPFVLKPNVGFLSFGVYPVKNSLEWNKVILKLEEDIERIRDIFPLNVVNTSEFIIEEMIEGQEYAIDAYYNKNGEAVILNIFHHPFFDDKDVSDRVYYTNKEIIEKYLEKFKNLLNKIGKAANIINFPFHLELRVNNEEIVPIEMNPMRFCGWCITDIAQNAWGINVYECFIKQKEPNWNEILKKSSDDYYYFTIGEIPSEINRSEIKKIDFDKYIKNIKNPLDIRKIDYKTKPVFAIVFAKTKNLDEIENILKLNMRDFILL